MAQKSIITLTSLRPVASQEEARFTGGGSFGSTFDLCFSSGLSADLPLINKKKNKTTKKSTKGPRKLLEENT